MIRPRFRRLEYLYLTALGCIALSILVSQVLIQTSIEKQRDDARVINVAGRQRMLSQKISKLALEIEQRKGDSISTQAELAQALSLWKKSHVALQVGNEEMVLSGQNSKKTKKMFEEVEPHFQAIYTSGQTLLSTPASDKDSLSQIVDVILDNEHLFLEKMDRIVFQYDEEARSKVMRLKNTEYYLLFVSLLIIGLELLFVFRPLAKNIRSAVIELQDSQASSQTMAEELSKLYEELGKSYQDLEAVNITPESPSIYGSLTLDGKFTYFSNTLHNIMEYEENLVPDSFQVLLIKSGYNKSFVDGLMELLNEGKNWSGELRLITEPGDFCWLDAFLVPVSRPREVKIIAKDITEFKEAKIRSRELNRERIEKSVKEQHYRSALILEGQEEERKRLSRELHDGVGQMLSALKLLLESLTASSKPMQMRLEDAKGLMKSIIQEVRRVSFNLTPSSLDDFGLVAAVNKFCEEINGVTKTTVRFDNKTRFINRLESNIETNLYRIIQESVNNALKYAKATKITVSFSHNINSLNISIIDDGKGFDYDRVDRSGHFEKAGHGIFNMRERTSYIGGTFKIESKPGKGTQIFITLSLDKND